MAATFKIHPAIGIARLGTSPTSFYLAPEATGALPIDCDPDGNPIVKDGQEQPVTTFKDDQGRIRRQAARFHVFVYDATTPQGRELAVGDTVEVAQPRTGQVVVGQLTDITWKVYLANKKASWYEFKELDGEYGYLPGHPLRNAAVTDPQARQSLIIDPGPRQVSYDSPKKRVAHFAQGTNPAGPDSFPPPLRPHSVTTLGEIRATRQDNHLRLLVLGGFGNSGSMMTGFGDPMIHSYANNDGWFDDISDGPVNARLTYTVQTIDGHPAPPGLPPSTVDVQVPAWVIVGYPRYAPQITDIVTMHERIFDVAVRNFAYAPLIYGVPPYDGARNTPTTPAAWQSWRQNARWNPDYYPYFWRDIWPILTRPFTYQWVMDFDPTTGGDPHQTAAGSGGNMDPGPLCIPPHAGENPNEQRTRRQRRMLLYHVQRKEGRENLLTVPEHSDDPEVRLLAMPLLCGDNPISNVAATKFFRLTDTMLFLLRQWAEGKFVNEKLEDITPPAPPPGVALDHGVLGNLLGGSFCPGAETSWIIRNMAIYAAPYRLRHKQSVTPGSLSQPAAVAGADTTASLADGLEPGDITKYSGVPWQADFNECSTQSVDITYDDWNRIDPASTGDLRQPRTQTTYWWPSHRPMKVFQTPAGPQVDWSPTAQSNAGDFEMVTAWATRSFILRNPDGSYSEVDTGT